MEKTTAAMIEAVAVKMAKMAEADISEKAAAAVEMTVETETEVDVRKWWRQW
jgi:L-alanine-DL-glutamate epimerase-like enolase superfamily enzyme